MGTESIFVEILELTARPYIDLRNKTNYEEKRDAEFRRVRLIVGPATNDAIAQG